MALRAEIEAGINAQADHVANNGALGTAALCRSLIALGNGDTACGRRIAAWDDTVLRDAMPLRLTGGLHDLLRRGLEPELGAVYRGEISSQKDIDTLVCEIVARHDAALLSWLAGPPQTNEAARSASFVAGLHWLAGRVAANFELNEIGSSAGMNLLVDRYRYDLSGVVSGPVSAPVKIKPVWNGAPPPGNLFTITSVQGCDLQPIDVRDDAAANRLMAYIWPEMPERFERMEAGIKMIREQPVNLEQADAADWLEVKLVHPQQPGTTRVLMHSIVWPYLPDATQNRIQSAMAAAGDAATPDKPLAWISLETNRATFRHELKVSYWPSGSKAVMLGEAHAHGAWINWHGI